MPGSIACPGTLSGLFYPAERQLIYEVVQAGARARGLVLAGQMTRLSAQQGQARYPELLRRVHKDLQALPVGQLYRQYSGRDQIPASIIRQLLPS